MGGSTARSGSRPKARSTASVNRPDAGVIARRARESVAAVRSREAIRRRRPGARVPKPGLGVRWAHAAVDRETVDAVIEPG